jgi:ribonucleoside-diphosphate reductase alpha chain
MSTSVIDYIFRELALSYLGRTDLVQVKPEDLRGDTVGLPDQSPAFDEEEVENDHFEGVVPQRATTDHTAAGFNEGEPDVQTPLPFGDNPHATGSPTSTLELNQRNAPAQYEERIVSGNGANGKMLVSAPATSQIGEIIRQARLKGYEGDPCSNCGAFTMVRNGVCLKCDSCGETSGCS